MIDKQILHYRILEKLGEGGMGIVYKAEDTKLNRDVAIKILPPHLLVSKDDRARFNREAKAAAALNHAHIATVYEINEYESTPFIVMEYIAGQTLNHHIEKGPLKLKDTISIAVQVAEGLSAAHGKDIVHRDIKSSNIILSTEKQAKILDFGLAKTSMSTKLTQMGSTVGTVAYMSPEQVRGEEVDHRTDLWSLGVLLYEMIAGRLPFKADYDQAIFYNIQNENPEPLTALRTGVPMSLEWIVNKLMVKSPDERYQNAKDLIIDLKAVDLENSGFSRVSNVTMTPQVIKSVTGIPVSNRKTGKLGMLLFKLSSILAVIILAGVTGWSLQPGTEKELRKFEWPEEYDQIEISPDGKKIAISQNREFWIRYLDSFKPVPIENEHTVLPPVMWSWDSKQLAYYVKVGNKNELRKVSAKGGKSILIANINNFTPYCWGADDSIVVADTNNRLYKMASSGGELKKMFSGDSADEEMQGVLEGVSLLPDGRSLLICVNEHENSKILIKTDQGTKIIFILPLEIPVGQAVYSPTGHIVYHRLPSGTANPPDIWAMPFDPGSMTITGKHFLVVANAGWPNVAENNILFYGKSEQTVASERLVLLSRNGAVIDSLGQRQETIFQPRFSPNGRMITYDGSDASAGSGIWITDLNKGTSTQLMNGEDMGNAEWKDDGKTILFTKINPVNDHSMIFEQNINGFDVARPLNNYQGDFDQFAAISSRDGRYFLISAIKDNVDIWLQEKGHEPKPLINTSGHDRFPCLSPDEKYVVFDSDRSGRTEVYITRFPEVSVQRKISVDGGAYPLWIGNEIFYVNNDNELLVVKVDNSDTDIKLSPPQVLFSGDQHGLQLANGYNSKYDVSSDGKTIVGVSSPQSTNNYMVLVENWFEEFKDKN